MVKKKDYQDILDCIKSDQVSAPEIAKYFEDKGFYKFYKDNQKPTKKDTNEWIKGYRKWKKNLTQFNCKA
tara:strand:- start:120 stop:329 length:210 start_codon:yes stop_codon:yes gene_type:complete